MEANKDLPDVKKIVVVYGYGKHADPITTTLHDVADLDSAMRLGNTLGNVTVVIYLSESDSGDMQIAEMLGDSNGAPAKALNRCFAKVFLAGIEHAKKKINEILGPQG